jgi:hypothetical protein
MPTEKEITENLKNCPRFSTCSINKCPLDDEVNLRIELDEEKSCPFTIKKREKGQKGIRTQAPDIILKVIPESNIKLLNKRNQKRWHAIHQEFNSYSC